MRKYLAYKELQQVDETLRGVIVTNGDNTCHYQDGWSDKKVAEELGFSHHSIARFRRQNYGDLVARPAPKLGQEAIDELKALLCAQAKTLARHQKLLDHLFRELGMEYPQ